MAKKEFTRKNQIHNLIRKEFNSGMSISDLEDIKSFIETMERDYVLKAETLAYVIQSINRYALANEFRKNNQNQTYPVIQLIDVVEFCKDYGYDNIYTTINDNLSFKFEKNNKIEKTASRRTLKEYNTMKKSAELSNKTKEFENDNNLSRIKKFSESKKASLLDQVSELYWQIPNVERFIKTAYLDTNPKIKEVLDIARKRKIFTSAKYASTAFVGFNNMLKLVNEIIELNK